MPQKTVYTDSIDQTAMLFGSYDASMRKIEAAFGVTVQSRDTERTSGNALILSGDDEAVEKAARALECLKDIAAKNGLLTEQNVDYVIDMVRDGSGSELEDFGEDCICITLSGKPVKARTVGQKKYMDAIRRNTIVLGIGPAGTGKTYLAVAAAVAALRARQVGRIVLTRPAVEAGERLGYLPGDLQNKIDPYLRPLHDALFEMLGAESYAKNLERGVIEIAPLAYMRGRTLDNAFIILDEAQNTTPEQMKMFLTRLGEGSKAVVTGDITQTDLPRGQRSGLVEALHVLEGVEDIGIHYFTQRDVVRHRLVQQIILAYEKYEKTRKNHEEERQNDKTEKKNHRFYQKRAE